MSISDPTYSFEHILPWGGSKPTGHVSAKNDDEAYVAIAIVLAESGSTLVSGSIRTGGLHRRPVPDPPKNFVFA